ARRNEAYREIAYAQARSGEVENAGTSAANISDPGTHVYVQTFVAERCHERGNTVCYEANMRQARCVSLSIMAAETLIFISDHMIRSYLDFHNVEGAIAYAEELQ